jgi:hypothetical protein
MRIVAKSVWPVGLVEETESIVVREICCAGVFSTTKPELEGIGEV